MPSTLRLRLSQGAASLLALGVLFHGLGSYLASNRVLVLSDSGAPSSVSTSYTVLTVLSAIGTFCIAVAVVMAAGVVASLVIEEGLERRLWMDADFEDGEDPDVDEAE